MKKLILCSVLLVCLVLMPSFVIAQSKPFVEAKNFALKYGIVNSNGDHEFLHNNPFPIQLSEFSKVYGFLYRHDEGDYIVLGKNVENGMFYIYYDEPEKLYYSYIHTYNDSPVADYKEYTEEEATKLAENFFIEYSNLLKKERGIYEENHL